MAGDIYQKFGTSNQSPTWTLTSLAHSLTAGRECTVIDNSSNLFEDILVMILLKTAAGTVGVDKAAYLAAYATTDDGTNYSGGASGSDAALTPGDEEMLRRIATLPVPVAATAYKYGPFSLASQFGGFLPSKVGLWLRNATNVALSSTASDCKAIYQGVKHQYT